MDARVIINPAFYACSTLYDGYVNADGERLAEPLEEEEAGAMGVTSDAVFAAPLFAAGACTSTFDLGWELARTRDLPPWAAIIARKRS